MKVYFVCDFEMANNYKCYGLLDNGFCFGEHVCSSPSFAPGDLYFDKPAIQEALKQVWQVDPAEVKANSETLVIHQPEEVPRWLVDLNAQNAGPQQSQYIEFESIANRLSAEQPA